MRPLRHANLFAYLLLLPVSAAASAIQLTTEASIAEVVPTIVAAGSIDSSTYATLPATNGIAQLLLTRQVGPGTYQTSLCSGAVIDGGSTILTAGHCVTDSAGDLILQSGTARVTSNGSTQSRTILGASVHPLWTGNGFLGSDVAVIRLSTPFTNSGSYGLYSGTNETGQVYDVYGYGRRGSNGTGYTSSSPTGAARHGQNRFEVNASQLIMDSYGNRLGSSDVLLSDFDDGTARHDAFGYYFGLNNTGLGLNEVSTAPGDSGGPALIGGMIAGITSFGFRFAGTSNSDIDGTLNSSYGEFNAFTRVSSHSSWILSDHNYTLVPEPGTWAIAGAGLALILLGRQGRTTS